jgi:CheY-like chemotaxis protein
VASSRRATVLVLEDNAAVQDLIEQALREPGHRVLSTNNPLEALDVVRRVHVDIVVAGVFLGEGTDALVGKLRSIQAGLEVVSIHGANDDADSDRDTILASPTQLDELGEIVGASVRR